jgi:aldehyde dehydrogenase family 7 member A1
MAAGNATIWKPSHTTPLCSIAVTNIVSRVLEKNGIPGAVAGLVTGDRDVGSAIAESRQVELGWFHLSFGEEPVSDNHVVSVVYWQ